MFYLQQCDTDRNVIITGSLISAEACELMQRNNLSAIVLPGTPSSAEIADAVRQNRAVAIIVRTGQIDDVVLSASDSLRVVVKHGVGTDNFDIDSANRNAVAVMTTHNMSAASVAEHTLALMLAVLKRVAHLDRRMRDGHWDKATHRGFELAGKSACLVGYGRTARQLATLLQPFDVSITAVVRRLPDDTDTPHVRFSTKLDESIPGCDIVSVHCPLTDLTRNLISTRQFELMRPSAILINTARGAIVDEAALVTALQDGKIFGAGLDCFASEPLPADSPLLGLDNLVVTPHIGWATQEAARRKGCMTVENILSVIDDRPIDMDCLVNPTVLAR